MNNIIRKSAILAATAAALFFNTDANAQDKLVYEKQHNSSIGVTVQNAEGATYIVKDKKGNVVMTGKINSKNYITLPIAKLKSGDYLFCIGGYTLQEFSVK